MVESNGLKAGLVTNDQGKGLLDTVSARMALPVDNSFSQSQVEEITGGCFCCRLDGGATELLPDVLEIFQKAGADLLFLQYDEAGLRLPPDARVIRDKGFKFPLAIRHMHPDTLTDYDFIFIWDDDLGVTNFNPERFVSIMEANRLDMAQPAIKSPHGLSHAITKHRLGPPPWRAPDGEVVYPVVGRLTNFVEIMAPVFTREAWREFYGYLDPENRSGWGYDYIPLGRKGIVDELPVVHTRAVHSINGDSEKEIRRFLDAQGLFRHAPVEHGSLFEWDKPEKL